MESVLKGNAPKDLNYWLFSEHTDGRLAFDVEFVKRNYKIPEFKSKQITGAHYINWIISSGVLSQTLGLIHLVQLREHCESAKKFINLFGREGFVYGWIDSANVGTHGMDYIPVLGVHNKELLIWWNWIGNEVAPDTRVYLCR